MTLHDHLIFSRVLEAKSKVQRRTFHVRFFLTAIVSVLFGLGTSFANANVIFVGEGQTTNAPADGLAWATAFPKIQDALASASFGDELWVAAGTYYENIVLSNGVAIYAGFGGGELDRSQRDWTKHLTILDGRQSNTVVIVEAGATNTTRIDGFVIRNGNASQGGGILCSKASPTIVNNIILQNQATGSGGGIRCFQSSPLIAFNLIEENSSGFVGGGIECVASAPIIENNRIVGNLVNQGAGRAGAGVSCMGSPSPQIRNNVIVGNLANNSSGQGGAIWVGDDSSPGIINNTILWNQAAFGGGIYCYSNHAIIANNIIALGTSGVRAQPGIVLKSNCIFENNTRDFQSFPDPIGTNGNIAIDPQITSMYPYPDIHLSPSSPCRDAGDNAQIQPGWLDFDGSPRLQETAVDIGADEFESPPPAFVPRIVRVSNSGDDANDGSSWSKAKKSVQAGIDAATFSGGEIWVQAGTYAEQLNLRHFVYLFGGFSGTETNRGQRNWNANATILDGQQSGSVVTATYLLQWNSVDGLLIQHGRANTGGGIYCYGSSPIIANNTITGNSATNTTYLANWAGGGIYCDTGSPVITNNVISLNYAVNGGGIYVGYFAAPFIANNRIETNVAITHLGMTGLSPYGGGGIFVAGNASPTILNNFILDNVATNDPSAFQAGSGGGICTAAGTTPQIIGNTLLGNLASSPLSVYPENGGGIYCDVRAALIVNNLIAFGSSGIRASFTDVAQNVRNNCVYGNPTNYIIIPDVTGTNGNIDADPLLVSTNDFHLRAGSPCIDAGDDSIIEPGWLDLDGQARRAGAHVDIGADEFGSSLPFGLTLLGTGTGGQQWLRLTGEPGSTYVFESSPDLMNWTPFSTNQATNLTLDVSELMIMGPGLHFYRAFSPAH